MRPLLRLLALGGLAVALGPTAAGASGDGGPPHGHDVPTEEAPPPPAAEPEPPPDEQRQRARDVMPSLRDRPAPASRDALDRARRNAESGVPQGRDRSLDSLSNDDFNQVLVGPRGQKIIIRETEQRGQTTRSVTIMDNEVTSSRGQGSRACSSVGSIGESPDCQ